jgi:hypothetical protein
VKGGDNCRSTIIDLWQAAMCLPHDPGLVACSGRDSDSRPAMYQALITSGAPGVTDPRTPPLGHQPMIVQCLRCGLRAEQVSGQRRYPRDYLIRCAEIEEKAQARGTDRREIEECSFLNRAFDLALHGLPGA